MTEPCPLCRGERGRRLWSVPYADVWSALAVETGRAIADDVRDRYTPVDDAVLVACDSCALHYFDPVNAGGSDFYEYLDTPHTYYVESPKWEFRRTGRTVDGTMTVLDIGCGNGIFVRRIAPRVARAVGIDTNSVAISRLAADGIEAYCTTVEAFAGHHAAAFDIVCLFQVIEHLDDVVPFVSAAAACARPGGTVLVSVPNRDRVRIGPLDPFDFPPHHVSRWSTAALRQLGTRAGLDVTGITTQRRTPLHIARALPAIARRLVRRRPGAAHRATPADVGVVAGEPDSFAERLRRLTYEHTLLAHYRKP